MRFEYTVFCRMIPFVCFICLSDSHRLFSYLSAYESPQYDGLPYYLTIKLIILVKLLVPHIFMVLGLYPGFPRQRLCIHSLPLQRSSLCSLTNTSESELKSPNEHRMSTDLTRLIEFQTWANTVKHWQIIYFKNSACRGGPTNGHLMFLRTEADMVMERHNTNKKCKSK